MALHTERTLPLPSGETITEVTGNIFSALGASSGDAARLQARADLMNALAAHIESAGWTQAVAARHLGTTQARVSALTRGRFADFSLDALVTMAARADLHVRIELERAAP